MRLTRAVAIGVLTVSLGLAASSTARAEVQLSIQNGRVTLLAKDATLRQILAEWAKVGQTRIVNGERAPGGPITLQLTNVPELQALDTLLRALSGYVAAPRENAVAGLSLFDRIVILPTIAPPSTAVASAAPPPPVAFPPPMFSQPGIPAGSPPPGSGLPQPDDQDDDRPNPNRGPVFNTFPQPQVGSPIQQGMPITSPGNVAPAPGPLMLPPPNSQAPSGQPYPSSPTAPVGVSSPGMIVPVPPQPGQPGQPLSGQQPQKRPGGNR